MEDKRVMKYIAFLNEFGKEIGGWFEVLLDNGIIIKFKTSNNNILTIPYSRILKIKEKEEKKAEKNG